MVHIGIYLYLYLNCGVGKGRRGKKRKGKGKGRGKGRRELQRGVGRGKGRQGGKRMDLFLLSPLRSFGRRSVSSAGITDGDGNAGIVCNEEEEVIDNDNDKNGNGETNDNRNVVGDKHHVCNDVTQRMSMTEEVRQEDVPQGFDDKENQNGFNESHLSSYSLTARYVSSFLAGRTPATLISKQRRRSEINNSIAVELGGSRGDTGLENVTHQSKETANQKKERKENMLPPPMPCSTPYQNPHASAGKNPREQSANPIQLNNTYETPNTARQAVDRRDLSMSTRTPLTENAHVGAVTNHVRSSGVNELGNVNTILKSSEHTDSHALPPPLPLEGCVIWVYCIASAGRTRMDASTAIEKKLVALGSTVTNSLTQDVTHVIFSHGGIARGANEMLHKKMLGEASVEIHSRVVQAARQQAPAIVVSPLWVQQCEMEQRRAIERPFTLIKPSDTQAASVAMTRLLQSQYSGSGTKIASNHKSTREKHSPFFAVKPAKALKARKRSTFEPQDKQAYVVDLNSPEFSSSERLKASKRPTTSTTQTDSVRVDGAREKQGFFHRIFFGKLDSGKSTQGTNSVENKDLVFDASMAHSTKQACHVKTSTVLSDKASIGGQFLQNCKNGVVALSNLTDEDRSAIQAALKSLPGRMRECHLGQWKSMTHLVLAEDPIGSNEYKRTLKLLLAIANGVWILHPSWVYRSIEEGKWLDEEKFEWDMAGAKRSREMHEVRIWPFQTSMEFTLDYTYILTTTYDTYLSIFLNENPLSENFFS